MSRGGVGAAPWDVWLFLSTFAVILTHLPSGAPLCSDGHRRPSPEVVPQSCPRHQLVHVLLDVAH
jgi:hypothetical protein